MDVRCLMSGKYVVADIWYVSAKITTNIDRLFEVHVQKWRAVLNEVQPAKFGQHYMYCWYTECYSINSSLQYHSSSTK